MLEAEGAQPSTVRVVGIPQATLHFLLLLLLIVLVTVFYERGHPEDLDLISMQTWSVGLEPCDGTAHCSNCSGLPGFVQRSESLLDRRLFATLGVPFMVLCPQVISAAFFMCYIRNESPDNLHPSNSNLQKSLKRVALAVQLVFATCFLFIQHTWHLPSNNLLLGEIWLLSSIFYITFHPASHYSQNARQHYTPTRFLEFAFTMPFLAVAALAAGGLTDVDDLNWVFFTSLFCCLFVLSIEFHTHKQAILKVEPTAADNQAMAILHVNAWLCLVAFLIPCSVATEQALAAGHPAWATAAIVLIMLLHILYLLSITAFQLGGYDHYALFITVLDSLSACGKCAVTLTIMGGCLSIGAPSSISQDHFL